MARLFTALAVALLLTFAPIVDANSSEPAIPTAEQAVKPADEAKDPSRVALVIGNGSYEHTSSLKNPPNDARAITTMLFGLGFDVIEGFDLNKAQLESKVREFSKKLAGSKVGLLYYAGHGLQVDGVNYLVPVDANVDAEDDLDFELMPLRQLIKRMERKSKVNLVFLDACRNNPITRSLAANMGTRSTAVGRGLARVNAGVGTLVSFATQPGNVALDGEGRNSPFTEAIIKHLPTPDLDVVLMMRRVRRDVLAATDGKQVPWTNSSLTDGFYFTPGTASTETGSDEEIAPSSKFLEISTAYRSVQEVGTCKAYEVFETAYPDSMFAELSNEWRNKNCGPTDPRELALSLQSELTRVGCSPGAIDGAWGGKSRAALAEFGKHAKLDIKSFEPSQEALTAVKSHQSSVCPERVAPPVQVKANPQVKQTKSGTTAPSTTTSRTTSKRTGRQKVAGQAEREKIQTACMLGSLAACQLGCRKGSSLACKKVKLLRRGG